MSDPKKPLSKEDKAALERMHEECGDATPPKGNIIKVCHCGWMFLLGDNVTCPQCGDPIFGLEGS